ncbi:hypothetical protein [Candidatus Synchoanobacter obligatus]|uniref:Uncharacterized protein n=1 Tax=Candidatus Synchoanobacter obligatus TaxID=2919597 RepID=A0ABT1L672_9GAMM|nr:hypothetical protein [Candidatus Synchoanobacter obligatus]MCP8352388.1 hypothetical protein [Candidatus Synchoanobacter obligatus]
MSLLWTLVKFILELLTNSLLLKLVCLVLFALSIQPLACFIGFFTLQASARNVLAIGYHRRYGKSDLITELYQNYSKKTFQEVIESITNLPIMQNDEINSKAYLNKFWCICELYFPYLAFKGYNYPLPNEDATSPIDVLARLNFFPERRIRITPDCNKQFTEKNEENSLSSFIRGLDPKFASVLPEEHETPSTVFHLGEAEHLVISLKSHKQKNLSYYEGQLQVGNHYRLKFQCSSDTYWWIAAIIAVTVAASFSMLYASLLAFFLATQSLIFEPKGQKTSFAIIQSTTIPLLLCIALIGAYVLSHQFTQIFFTASVATLGLQLLLSFTIHDFIQLFLGHTPKSCNGYLMSRHHDGSLYYTLGVITLNLLLNTLPFYGLFLAGYASTNILTLLGGQTAVLGLCAITAVDRVLVLYSHLTRYQCYLSCSYPFVQSHKLQHSYQYQCHNNSSYDDLLMPIGNGGIMVPWPISYGLQKCHSMIESICNLTL